MDIDQIKISKRHRKDMGDIDALAASMASVGLLHPVVIDRDNNLICGERRIVAALKLEWANIDVTVAEDIDDIQKAIQAEKDENTCRKAFTPTEAAAMAEALEPMEKAAAKERQESTQGNKQTGVEKFSAPEKGRAADKVADAVGMSSPTLTKARVVAKAAQEHPEEYGDIAEAMDLTGKVSPAYDELERLRKAEKPKPAVDPKYVGDWNAKDQDSRFWRIMPNGKVMYLNAPRGVYRESGYPLEFHIARIDAGELMPNTNYDGFWNVKNQSSSCLEVGGDQYRSINAKGRRNIWLPAANIIQEIKSGMWVPNRWPIPPEPKPEPEKANKKFLSPWYLSDQVGATVIRNSLGNTVAGTCSRDGKFDDIDHLIAAAPEMYSIIRDFLTDRAWRGDDASKIIACIEGRGQ